MMTIVTEFGTFIYNRLPMGICALGDIFQVKVDEILGDIKGVKIYIYDLLVLSKEIFYMHIDQLNVILTRLRAVVLKVNVPN